MTRQPATFSHTCPLVPLRRTGWVAWLLAGWLVLLAAGSVHAEKASEWFLDAYLMREEGAKAEKAGDFKRAYDQYREAARLYDQIARDYPDWKPAMVSFRRKGMAEQIAGVAEKAAKMEIGRTSGDTRPLPPGAVPAAAPATRPVVPARTPPAGPNVVARPPAPAATAGGDDPFARLRIQELERQQAGARQTMEMLAKERDALKTRLVEVENSRNLSGFEARKYREERDTARRQLADLQEKGINASVAEKARIAGLEKKLADMDKAVAEAAAKARAEALANADEATRAAIAERDRISRQLAETEAELAAARRGSTQLEDSLRVLTAERDRWKEESGRWKTERDQLAAQLEAKGGDTGMVEANQRLEKELAEARAELARLAEARAKDAEARAKDSESLAKMEAQSREDAERMAELRDRLRQLEGELTAARKENAAFRDQMSTLEKRLAEAKAGLESAPPAVDPAMEEENRTLKTIVIRQLRQQAYRARARNLLLSELAKLEINSKALLQYIDQLEGKGSMPGPEEVTRIADHEIRALAGVELTGQFFPSSAADSLPETTGETGTSESPPPGTDATAATTPPGTDATPPGAPSAPSVADASPPAAAGEDARGASALASRPDAAGAFDFQKRSLAQTAESAFLKGDFQQAEETYRLIVEADPDDTRMQCNLGVSLLKQERFAEAIARFQDALSREETNAFAHLMLGVCHWKLREPELAVDRLNRSLVLQPANPQAWLYLGLVAVDANQWRDAETAFKKALEIKPDYALGHYNLAVVYTKPGFADPVQAKRSYDESLRLGGARDEAVELFLRVGTAPAPDALEADPDALPSLEDPIPPPPPGPDLPPDAAADDLPTL